jgi:hypothetical protein
MLPFIEKNAVVADYYLVAGFAGVGAGETVVSVLGVAFLASFLDFFLGVTVGLGAAGETVDGLETEGTAVTTFVSTA